MSPWRWRLAACALAALLFGGLLARVLQQNGGRFTYSLDDPYIHLALSEELVRGHYGLEASEHAAPSSSVIWPWLLAPAAPFAFHEYVPLVLAALSLLVSAGLLDAILVRAGLDRSGRDRLWRLGWILLLLSFLNVVGIAFTGMEHSLAILCVLATVLGMVAPDRDGRGGRLGGLNPWLVLGVVLGPLVRYENAAVSVAALAPLAVRRRWLAAVLLGALAAVGPLAFSLYLRSLGLPWLPSSVLTKSAVVSGDGLSAALAAVRANFAVTLANPQGQVLLFLGALCLVRFALSFRRAAQSTSDVRADRGPALAGALLVLAHACAGRYGWWGRYEVYALLGAAALVLFLWRGALLALAARVPAWAGVPALAALFYLAMPALLRTTWRTPQACNNIYEQQFQMHRFALDYGAPLAANDIGWVAYRNPHYVLDVYGLSSERIRALRFSDDSAWLGNLLDEYGVRAAMLFEPWYRDVIPERWIRVGTLSMGGWRVLPAPTTVTFWATVEGEVPAVARALERLAPGLPPTASVHFERGIRSGG